MARLAGTVIDDIGGPITKCRVAVSFDIKCASTALLQVLAAYGRSASEAITGENGEFQLYIPYDEREVVLTAESKNHVPTRVGPLTIPTRGKIEQLLLRLARKPGVAGRIIDETGLPIPGGVVTVVHFKPNAGAAGAVTPGPETVSGKDGKFLLGGLHSGFYQLRVGKEGYSSHLLVKVNVKSDSLTQIGDVTLQSNGAILGRVVDIDGHPVSGVRVTCELGGGDSRSGISGKQGEFIIRGMRPAYPYEVVAKAPGFAEVRERFQASERDLVLVLRRASILQGRVEDADSLEPILEFSIRESLSAQERRFRSTDGTFTWTEFPSGRASLVVDAPGYQTTEIKAVEIGEEGVSPELVIPLHRGLQLSGSVVDAATGIGIVDANVSYYIAGRTAPGLWQQIPDSNRQTTGLDGSFAFDNLPPVSVVVVARAAHYAPAQVTATAGADSVIEIRLVRGASISGTVMYSDPSGLVPSAAVSIENITDGSTMTIQADDNAQFNVDALAAGRYRLYADALGFGKSSPYEIVLHDDEVLSGLILKVRSGVTVHGQISGLLAGERVLSLGIKGTDDALFSPMVDETGAYSVSGVPSGPVEFLVYTTKRRTVGRTANIPASQLEFAYDINLPMGSRLSGRISHDGKPARQRVVVVSLQAREFFSVSTQTDSTGNYCVEGLTEGRYIVSVGEEVSIGVQVAGDTRFDIRIPSMPESKY
jgi:hypothetical protein